MRIGNTNKPLKARLPKLSEVKDAGCKNAQSPCSHCGNYNIFSCSSWLLENLKNTTKQYDESSYMNETYGYWLLDSAYTKYGYNVNDLGYISHGNITNEYYQAYSSILESNINLYYGIRPVITVPITYLQ